MASGDRNAMASGEKNGEGNHLLASQPELQEIPTPSTTTQAHHTSNSRFGHGYLSPNSPTTNNERIFPIRSIIQPIRTTSDVSQADSKLSDPRTVSASMGTNIRGLSQSSCTDRQDLSDRERLASNFVEELRQPIDDVAAEESLRSESKVGASDKDIEHPMTVRFQYREGDEDHFVVTGLKDLEMTKCEDEPIHIPGAVQGFGVLIALKEDGNRLVVRVASENSGSILGLDPSFLFSLNSFTELLSEEQQRTLKNHIQFCREVKQLSHDMDVPEVFSLSGRSQDSSRSWNCWCALHLLSTLDLIILEFELEDDHIFPACTTLPLGLEGKRGMENIDPHEPTPEDLLESTIKISKPLRLLKRKDGKQNDQIMSMEYFSILSQVNEQLAEAQDLNTLVKVVVGIFKEITEFHKVMIYQFDEKWNGQVVAELVDWNTTKDLYRGLHFPASDIPAQARELYKLNKVRLLYDRDQPTARLVCSSEVDLQTPLDMTHSYLRAMSPIHIKYLENMGVRSSMSISIIAFGELWGLISCHSYGMHGMRISFILRQLCRLIGEAVSRNIERLSLSRRLQARKLINTRLMEKSPEGYIVTKAEDLLSLFDADFGALSIGEEGRMLGTVENSQELIAGLQLLRLKRFTMIRTCEDLRGEFPDMQLQSRRVFENIAGFLLVPLSKDGGDFIVFFRKGQLQQVHWAGNPKEKLKKGPDNHLAPRKSFNIWSETVLGKCRTWTDEQLETAAVVHLVYGKFIEVWRQKEEALQISRMSSLLLNNASHEVRTPLNAIINYLEIALEGQLDNDTREHLVKSYAASKSLIYVINDLLDLTRTEVGKDLFRQEVFNLPVTIQDAVQMFEHDPNRTKPELSFTVHPNFPVFVLGDPVKIRQVVSNVVANAIYHTEKGSVTVVGSVVDRDEANAIVEISVTDTGSGISSRKLDAIFQNFEQLESLDSQPEQGTGLGLAIVARIVHNMNGQLRVESDEGKGSRFTFNFNFPLPSAQQTKQLLEGSRMSPREEVVGFKTSTSSLKRTDDSNPPRYMDYTGIRETATPGSDSYRRTKVGTHPSLDKKDVEASSAKTSVQGTSFINVVKEQIDSGVLDTSVRSAKICEDDVDVPALRYQSVQKQDNQQSSAFDKRPLKSETWNKSNLKSINVLVAEDDPVNQAIMKKRLEMDGHRVRLTNDGAEAVNVYLRYWWDIDVILMDLQMPLLDGIAATVQIRTEERQRASDLDSSLPFSHRKNGNTVPIFAVSASLPQKRYDEITGARFDGWILKPLNFRRLNDLIKGIWDDEKRKEDLFVKGESKSWERGGWFTGPQEKAFWGEEEAPNPPIPTKTSD